MRVKRACDLYVRGCGIKRMGIPVAKKMKRALERLVRNNKILSENEHDNRDVFDRIVRMPRTLRISVRDRGPRDFYDVPPSEVLRVALRFVEKNGYAMKSEAHYLDIIGFYGQKNLTEKIRKAIRYILSDNSRRRLTQRLL